MVVRAKKCPPGVLCVSTTSGYLLLGAVVIAVVLIGLAIVNLRTGQPQPQPQPQPIQITLPPQPAISVVTGGDDRYSRPPRPQRFWDMGPELPPRGALLPPDGGIPINIHTQGLPEAYQSMGLLKTHEGKLLPLYGRRVASRSDRFNYYTRTDTYNPVPLPLQFQKRDCQDDIGCNELFSGDKVVITPTGDQATATLYRFDGPTYIPSIV